MTRNLLIFLVAFLALECRAETRIGNAILYDYLGMDYAPLPNVEILAAKPGLIRLRQGDRKIEHSGRFTIIEPIPPKETHWWQIGDGKDDIVDMVVLYGFAGMNLAPFPKVSLIESTAGFLVFDFNGQRYTHSGRYEIHR